MWEGYFQKIGFTTMSMNEEEYNPGKMTPVWIVGKKRGTFDLRHITSAKTGYDTPKKRENRIWNSMTHSDAQLRPEA